MKRRILSALCCLLLLSVLSMTVIAVEVPDHNRWGTISITMTYEGKTVPGGSLTLYRVAEIAVENGADYSFRYTAEYADCPVDLTDLGSPETAQALADYVKEKGYTGTTVKIDGEGYIEFTQLELGLYLLVQPKAAYGYYPVNPFLVSVPAMRDGSYVYNVDASPKLSLEPAPTQPTVPTGPTTPPDLPQTGLNQWPVPVLAIGGLLLFALGLTIYGTGKKKAHES